jgi:hypothetical protein
MVSNQPLPLANKSTGSSSVAATAALMAGSQLLPWHQAQTHSTHSAHASC